MEEPKEARVRHCQGLLDKARRYHTNFGQLGLPERESRQVKRTSRRLSRFLLKDLTKSRPKDDPRPLFEISLHRFIEERRPAHSVLLPFEDLFERVDLDAASCHVVYQSF